MKSRWILIDSASARNHASRDIPEQISTSQGNFHVGWHRLSGGKSDGVDLLEIANDTCKWSIVPTRGMGLWKCWYRQTEIGWNSPAAGPVHPQWVPLFDPSGLGWLEGFDELLVRCGLESNGAPEFHPSGQLRYPLHGRIANIPARQLIVEVHPDRGVLEVYGVVEEARFLVRGLQLETRYRFYADTSIVEIEDRVVNRSANASSFQLLYHINVGSPLLQAGSRLEASLQRLAPRNAHAAAAVNSWNVYEKPQAGFVEQVYFAQPAADNTGWSTALLHHPTNGLAFAVQFDTTTLPYFSLWKNTAAEEDGYVTGLEPGTGFPNRRSFEETRNRVIKLAGGASQTHRLQLEFTDAPERIKQLQQAIATASPKPLDVRSQPDPDWSE